MHLSATALIALAIALIFADWGVGTLKAIFSDHVQFSWSMLPKQFILVMAPVYLSLSGLATLQASSTGLGNTGATAGLVVVAGAVVAQMCNDLKNKLTSWIQGTPNLSPSTSDLLLGAVNKGIGEVQTLATTKS